MSSTMSPVSPSNSFRKIKSVLSPLGSPSPSFSNMSDAQSYMSSPACSPSRVSPSNRFSNASNFSNLSFQLRHMRNMIRRKPSTIEVEQEEERRVCNDGLLDIIEPRPSAVSHVNGIEEVLFGRL